MKTIKANDWSDVSENFTGIVEFSDGDCTWYKNGLWHREDGPAVEWLDGTKCWYVNGDQHRTDGPAVEYPNGTKYWYLEDRSYLPINLGDHVILDCYKGKYDLIWYKLLGKDKILEYPDIPGLITK